MVYSGDLKIFSGTAHPQLAKDIASVLGVKLGKTIIKRFSDGECYVRYEESVRGEDAYIIQPTCPDVDKNIMELLIMIDALKRASASRITVVVPYYGYACQEKKDKPREAITAKMVADLLTTTGADRIMTIDLHAGAIQGFFNIPVDHLTAIPIYVKYFKDKNLDNVVFVSPDEGRAKHTRFISSQLGAPLAVCYKFHPEHMETTISHIAGDVKGKIPVLTEDMIRTGGSINECVDTLLANGCKPEIYVAATHGLFTGKCFELLNRPEIKEIITLDTIPRKANAPDNFKTISCAPILAEAIKRIHENTSIQSLFL